MSTRGCAGAAAGASPVRASPGMAREVTRSSLERKPDQELGSALRRKHQGNGAAVAFDDAPDDGEAEAGAGGLGGEEGLEDAVGQVLANARTAVAHGDLRRRL